MLVRVSRAVLRAPRHVRAMKHTRYSSLLSDAKSCSRVGVMAVKHAYTAQPTLHTVAVRSFAVMAANTETKSKQFAGKRALVVRSLTLHVPCDVSCTHAL